ncbi:hypothetical protein OOK31_01870 [Streptomyces sp. NBC_00249]|uniref:hypothetical protein n=1 Tax=Streptomyces sp. NBC_00249 TaxID=2975690 RepID=UPI002253AC06|nr:hypothetical protein [Streptomyces sp. NBC_00249]MCX5192649.1 hypothetical protein [Streptomyces sp. NBC_00249]
MRDPHPMPPTLTALPECRTEPGPRPASPLPSCPVCDTAAERISWRQRPGEPVVLVFDPCGHRHTSPAPPLLAVTPAAPLRG